MLISVYTRQEKTCADTGRDSQVMLSFPSADVTSTLAVVFRVAFIVTAIWSFPLRVDGTPFTATEAAESLATAVSCTVGTAGSSATAYPVVSGENVGASVPGLTLSWERVASLVVFAGAGGAGAGGAGGGGGWL